MTQDKVTYWDYLNLQQLLQLQAGLTGDEADVSEDELHFIIVHQVFELWFKLTIRELRLARDAMAAPQVKEETIPYVVHHLKRVNTIMQMSASHFSLMETLIPQDFLEFRAKLGTASGFQSYQLRQLEFLLGLGQDQRDAQNHGDPAAYIMRTAGDSDFGQHIKQQMTQVQEETSLRESIHTWLYRTPIHGSTPSDPDDDTIVEQFIQDYLSSLDLQHQQQIDQLVADGGDRSKLQEQFGHVLSGADDFLHAAGQENQQRQSRIRAAILFIESYRNLPLLSWPRLLIDTIVEMEELVTTFRFRHARMVERIIGRRVGTGGSAGVDYLDQTTNYRVFPELWAVRTLLLPRQQLPDLKHRDLYHFASELQE